MRSRRNFDASRPSNHAMPMYRKQAIETESAGVCNRHALAVIMAGKPDKAAQFDGIDVRLNRPITAAVQH